MKKSKLLASMLVVCSGFILMNEAYADSGLCNYQNQTLSSVSCDGKAMLNGTTVTGLVQVAGKLVAVNSTIGSLHVDGPVKLINSTVKGPTEINGLLVAVNSSFNQAITIATDKLVLKRTKVLGPITVKSSSAPATVFLLCGSKINSSLSFIGKPGTVTIQDSSTLSTQPTNGQSIVDTTPGNCSADE